MRKKKIEGQEWFSESRFGIFIHWGPYSVYGRGEQVLFREHLDQRDYEKVACAWNPKDFNAAEWADTVKSTGARYAVLTTRHHDGFCMWDTKFTDYSSARQAPKRDFVGEYVKAFRKAGLKVGLYYSLADWRIPAYWDSPKSNPEGWNVFRTYVHNQVRELLTQYGKIDVIWFDGAWPHSADAWGSLELVKMIRKLQPHILINNRLDSKSAFNQAQAVEAAGESRQLGDFGTPEHHITPESGRLWESCQTSTWRLWGYTEGERWRSSETLLDFLCQCAHRGGNLLLNVGPDARGKIPAVFRKRALEMGTWLKIHREAVFGTTPVDFIEMVTRGGYQTLRGNTMYLIIRFWDKQPEMRLAGIETKVVGASLLSTGAKLQVRQKGDVLTLAGLPRKAPTPLFPVIKLKFAEPPKVSAWAKERLWAGDPRRMIKWAQSRGETVFLEKSKVAGGLSL